MNIANIILLVVWFICIVVLVWLIVQTSKTNKLEKTSGNTISGWIAREKNGELWFFMKKPNRIATMWNTDNANFMCIDSNLFPTLHWEDEPKKVSVTIKAE